MTDRIHDEQLDREIRSFLAWQAEDIAGAPSATEVAARISSRGGTRSAELRRAPQLVWVLLAGLLMAALIGTLVVGAMQRQDTPLGTSYEAVFLRLEVVDGSPEVIAVGVNAAGRERQIARLPYTLIADSVELGAPRMKYLARTAAVSPGGLLVIPRTADDGWTVHWAILDLHRPQAVPIAVPGIEQDFEQIQPTPYFRLDMRPSVFWGPGEQVAIPWYERLAENDWHLSFVDGRTGSATAADVPDGRRILPQWATDGSGVFIGDSSDADAAPLGILRPDGTVSDPETSVAVSSCRTRESSGAVISVSSGRAERRDAAGKSEQLPSAGRVGFACLAPDDSTIVQSLEIDDSLGAATAAYPRSTLVELGSGTQTEVQGSFAGWLEVDR